MNKLKYLILTGIALLSSAVVTVNAMEGLPLPDAPEPLNQFDSSLKEEKNKELNEKEKNFKMGLAKRVCISAGDGLIADLTILDSFISRYSVSLHQYLKYKDLLDKKTLELNKKGQTNENVKEENEAREISDKMDYFDKELVERYKDVMNRLSETTKTFSRFIDDVNEYLGDFRKYNDEKLTNFKFTEKSKELNNKMNEFLSNAFNIEMHKAFDYNKLEYDSLKDLITEILSFIDNLEE